MHELTQPIRFLPIHVIEPQMDKQESVYVGEELESLIATWGGVIVDRVIQKLDRPNMATFINSGKIVEVADIIREKQIDIVVLNSAAKARQLFMLYKEWYAVNPKIQVWDRIDLILNIFDKHAKTAEARLQIKLARINYMGPRIYGMGFELSQQGGGIGARGIGETNTELMKRHWRGEVKKVTAELKKLEKNREEQIKHRGKTGIKTVSLVGYTNAGKSSLFNALTGKKNYVENELFATLESTVGTLYLQDIQKEVLISDTIGFIRNLPPRLIKAFKSTLLESIHADLVLQLVDISDPEWEVKIQTVMEILQELGRSTDEVVFVFNKIDAAKIDQVKIAEQYAKYSPIFISAKIGIGVDGVIKKITQKLKVQAVEKKD